MTLGSLFSGCGGADMGFEAAGFSVRWQCEIERQPSGVLKYHWPETLNLGDVKNVKTKKLEPVNVLLFGFPCQDLSVAGKRKGLEGERSGLFYEATRIAKAIKPSYLVFENVPGLLSSDNGRDFARVLRHLGDIGYSGAWRVLDAQFFGVAQRRERVFGCFARRDIGAMRCAEILALTEGVQRHPAKGRKARERTARRLAPCLRSSGVGTERIGDTRGQDCVVAHSLRGEGFDASEDGTGRGTPLVAFGGGNCSGPIATATKTRNDFDTETLIVAPTMRANGDAHSGFKDEAGLITFAIQERAVSENLENGPGGKGYQADLAYTIEARNKVQSVASHMAVRRLTPRECERLMGWPDDWTRYGHDGKEIADGPRYKMIGNGVVKPVAEWIARRINTGENQ